jgi:hypothetical protein
MREKWVKFFSGRMQQAILNTDRVLKNFPTKHVTFFIED